MDEKTAAVPARATRRRRVTALAGLMLAVGTVAACGSAGGSTGASASATGQPSASASPSATASPSPSASPTPAPSASPSGPGIAVGEPAPIKLPALAHQVQGNTLTVWFYGGVCEKYGLKVDESKPGEVDVRVVVAEPAPRGKECPALAKRETVTAQLEHPLAGRKVIDLGTGQQVPLDPGPAGGPQ